MAENIVLPLARFLTVGLLALLSLLVLALSRVVLVRIAHTIAERTTVQWDDDLARHHVFHRVAHLAPAWLLHVLAPLMLPEADALQHAIERFVQAWTIVIVAGVVDGVLNTLVFRLEGTRVGERVAIKSVVQALKVVGFIGVIILVLSALFDRNPLFFFSGLGALTAVLLLVFKDSLLGLVAGIQISVNELVRKGDWIEMPKHGVDGAVLDVSLTTVKVQNWDRTISSVPSYALVSESFRNWRGMSDSGGRRIKRAVRIDVRSVRMLSDAERLALRKFSLLRPWLDGRAEEVAAWNREHGADPEFLPDGRQLTNLGSFRAYVMAYLQRHPKIDNGSTLLVRHLAPDAEGCLPMEIYCFTNDTRWAVYEDIQADIFDHLYAVIECFHLHAWQAPSGQNVSALGEALGPRPPHAVAHLQH